jgi:hypothetical protein
VEYTSTPSPFPSWRGARLKHRDNSALPQSMFLKSCKFLNLNERTEERNKTINKQTNKGANKETKSKEADDTLHTIMKYTFHQTKEGSFA